jgi:hypothetical protein
LKRKGGKAWEREGGREGGKEGRREGGKEGRREKLPSPPFVASLVATLLAPSPIAVMVP